MSRNSLGILERIVSRGGNLLSQTKTKAASLLATSALALGATGPCGITSSTTNDLPRDPPPVQNPEDIAISAKEYKHSIGFYVDEDMTPEQASDGMINYIENKGISTLTDYFAGGPLLSIVRSALDRFGSVGNTPTFDYYAKKPDAGSWSKNLTVGRGDELVFMMFYGSGDSFIHPNGLATEVVNKSTNSFEPLENIVFLEKGEETERSPTVFVTKYPISFERHMDPSYPVYLDQIFTIGGTGDNNGSPVTITVRSESKQPPQEPPGNNGNDLVFNEIEPNDSRETANVIDFPTEGSITVYGVLNGRPDLDSDEFKFHNDFARQEIRIELESLDGTPLSTHMTLWDPWAGYRGGAFILEENIYDGRTQFRSVPIGSRTDTTYTVSLSRCADSRHGCVEEDVPYKLTITRENR